MINFYHKFIPKFSGELSLLFKLNGKNSKWHWTNDHAVCFKKTKNLLANIETLTHYDPTKSIIISSDASPYGVGGGLSLLFDGIEKPVKFVSSTMSEAEKNYSQLHREALAIIFSVKKFHKYIYGLKFTILSDRQNGSKKDLSGAAGSRIQRWALFLSMYDFEIKYKKGSDIKYADGLSRLPLNLPTDIEPDSINNIGFSLIPLKLDDIAIEMQYDRILTEVYGAISDEWPREIAFEMKPYYLKRNSLARRTYRSCKDESVG